MLADLLASGGGPADVNGDVRELDRRHAPDLDLRARPGRARPGVERAAAGRRRPRRLSRAAPGGSSSPPGRSRRPGPGSARAAARRSRPSRSTEALRRVPAEPVTAPHPLPGFARSTVDGYAVRAADTYGVSEGLPGYLTVTGAVLMGAEPTATVKPGTAVAMPTGGALPPGADAVVMIEYTAEAMPGTIEVVRPVAPGEGVVRADEDAAGGPADHPERPRAPPPGSGHARGGGGDQRPRARAGRWSRSSPPETRWCRRRRRRCGPARSGTRPPRRWPRWSPTPAASRSTAASSPTTRAPWRRRCARPWAPATCS